MTHVEISELYPTSAREIPQAVLDEWDYYLSKQREKHHVEVLKAPYISPFWLHAVKEGWQPKALSYIAYIKRDGVTWRCNFWVFAKRWRAKKYQK